MIKLAQRVVYNFKIKNYERKDLRFERNNYEQ